MKWRFGINVGLWIGATVGLYSFLYALTPLGAAGVLPCTFVALPIFLNGGAKKEEFLGYCSSALLGVGWAAVFIHGIGFGISEGLPPAVSTGLVLFVVTAIICALHLIFTPKGLFSSIPMIFGAVASTFLIGLDKWYLIMPTLLGGILMGYINSLGFKLVDADGRWLFLTRSNVA
ncbi:DUF1097 domain-containing protein (plasmid) [Rhizobium sp. CB3090]|uniref:DUF1097 domain-containing protein n=1 Tax=Rhizobium sp. CB3090 TaxID=3039156 RepID=UPI0024B1E16A|nr:DUF1097 domain-containing protein [Rhizobium sp. CB3090]WFU12890.1 DUF1097 domain-containing protein [Rhizobium sp. CB3090]